MRAFALVHPFPSLLVAGVTGGLVLLAGGGAEEAARLAAAMLLLQASIGSANDLRDAADDARAHPGRPIPAGLVSPRAAAAVAVLAGLGGLVLAAGFGPPVLLVGAAGYGCGLAYDLRLKRTAWAWLPFAVGFALVPAFAWLAARGGLPPAYPWLAGLALPAGAALALANGAIDAEEDRRAGGAGPAARLGRRRAVRLAAALQAALYGGAVGGLLLLERADLPTLAAIGGAAMLTAAGLVGSARAERRRRRLGWEVQALGVAALAVGCVAAVVRGGI